MILDRIEILDFKNIADAAIDFSPGVNCLLGMNGQGKSNLLEAIHFASFARASSSIPDSALVRHGRPFAIVKADYTSDSGSVDHIACGITPGKGKSLKLNGKEYQRISDHIGRFPLVSVAPADSRIVEGAAEERRRLMDMVIAQAEGGYLGQLIRYNKALDSRNRMLRSGIKDPLLFESVEETMHVSARAVCETRAEWTRRISPLFAAYYEAVGGSAEKAGIAYRSQLLEAPLPELLRQTRQKDIILGYTSRGIHRDDLEMTLDGYSARRLGSQGQLKTFTIALRFAIFDFLKQAGARTPVLLLDDIFDKLDSDRVGRIMGLVSSNPTFGQIFITDTNRKHLDEILREIEGPRLMLEVADGTFTKITD